MKIGECKTGRWWPNFKNSGFFLSMFDYPVQPKIEIVFTLRTNNNNPLT